MSIRAVVVDDEPLARRRLRRLLDDHGGVTVVGEAADGESACELIDRSRPDVVFLDVQMPGLTGFDVLARLQVRPTIVFVTAHDEFAVRAFEEQALDYLLKPVEPARLARALARLHAGGAAAADDQRLERLLEVVQRRARTFQRIPVRSGAKVALVEPASIVFCRAEDKYVVLYTPEGEHIVDRTIDDLERSLDPEAFLRVHRSTIVNLAFVRDLTAIEGGRFVIGLKAPPGAQIYASRTGAKALREKLGF
ncbi:MAG TPA: response regulator [Vicinamibacterales bacterium]|nr:response regulator [Vicinamibacterales bacterium]